MTDRPLTIFAPAKINLYLHVTGRRDNGYHDIDSLAVFADIGDRVTIEPAGDFSLAIDGPYAGSFTAREKDYSPNSSNLVARAAWELSRATRRDLKYRVRLQKNLPLASGLGGGSADAAALIWGLMTLWDLPLTSAWLPDLMEKLGADVPVCLRSAPVRMRGIGEILDPVTSLPEMPVVLVNPGIHCPTADVFRQLQMPTPVSIPLDLKPDTPDELISVLETTRNDLLGPALKIVPVIENVLLDMSACPGCRLARMSGSGATVFGLFDTMQNAETAAEILSLSHPKWWVRHGTINQVDRY